MSGARGERDRVFLSRIFQKMCLNFTWWVQLQSAGRVIPLRVRSMVGLLPLLACTVLEDETLARLPGFTKRMRWFLENRADLAGHITWAEAGHGHRLLALPSRERPERLLPYMLDENQFLSP